jgi:hypothetical protein
LQAAVVVELFRELLALAVLAAVALAVIIQLSHLMELLEL